MKRFARKELLFLLLLLVFPLSLASCGSGQQVTSIVLQADFPANMEDADKSSCMEEAINIVRKRLDEYGVTKPIIQKQENDCILVQLPGISTTHVEEAKKLISQPGSLDFRQVEMNGSSTVVSLGDYLDDTGRTSFFDTSDATLQDANRIFGDANGQPIVFLEKSNEGLKYVDQNGNPVDAGQLDKTALSWMPAVGTVGSDVKALNGNQYLTDASLHDIRDQLGNISGYEVGIKWNKEGADLFGQITKSLRNRGDYGTPQRALGIFLDNVLISSPQVYPSDMTGEYGDTASITGNFTQSEAKLLAIELRFDALPMPLHVLSASPG